MAKTIKLYKSDDLSKAIKRIKTMRDREAIFEIEENSPILQNSSNLRLMRKTAEVLGKKVVLKTDSELGKVLAVKAGMELFGGEQISVTKSLKRTPVQRRTGDIEKKPDMSVKQQAPKSDQGFVEPPIIDDQSLRGVIGIPPNETPLSWWKSKYFKMLAGAMAALLLAVISLGAIAPKAEIIVYARSEPVTRDLEILVHKDIKELNYSRLEISGQLVSKELSHTKSFQSTGTKQVGDKAAGSIVMYNFTKNTLTLKASTTTLVANGKNYFFTRDVTGLRPTGMIGSGDDREVDRTTLIAPIPVVAENPGDAYNLPANIRFEIKNAALGENKSVYAVNEVAVGGGSAKTINIMSQADFDRALSQMSEELVVLGEQELASQGPIKVLPSGSKREILAKAANKNVGDETSHFDMTVIGRLTALSYNENDLIELVSERIRNALSSDRFILNNGRRDVSAKFKAWDPSAESGTLQVHFQTQVGYFINNENIPGLLAGKDAYQIKEILLQRPEIDRVDVKFSPFFVHKAPKFNGKIFVKTETYRQ
jgi:hypothetical protein